MPPKTKAQIAKEHVPHRLFPEFWKAYPRKVKKLEASIAYSRLDPSPELALRILIAVQAQRERGCLRPKPGGDVQFIPHASTWLNQRRWEDELEPAPASTSTDRVTRYAAETILDALTTTETTHVGPRTQNGTHPADALPDH